MSSCLSFYASLGLILCHRLPCPLSLGLWKRMEGLPMAILLTEGAREERIRRKKGHFENKEDIETRALFLPLPPRSSPFGCVPPNHSICIDQMVD